MGNFTHWLPKTHMTIGVVVDRIMTHQDVHVLIPGTYEYFEYVTLHGKGKSKLQMELRLLIRWSSNVETILDALGWENVIKRVEEVGRWEGQSEKDLTSWFWRWRKGPVTQGMQTSSKSWKRQGNRFFPKDSRWRYGPADPMILAQRPVLDCWSIGL